MYRTFANSENFGSSSYRGLVFNDIFTELDCPLLHNALHSMRPPFRCLATCICGNTGGYVEQSMLLSAQNREKQFYKPNRAGDAQSYHFYGYLIMSRCRSMITQCLFQSVCVQKIHMDFLIQPNHFSRLTFSWHIRGGLFVLLSFSF